ncbi:MAG: hypothetical protein ACR2II_05425 [Chthoniobacterales bacterium]
MKSEPAQAGMEWFHQHFARSEGRFWHTNDRCLTKQHETLDCVLPLGSR